MRTLTFLFLFASLAISGAYAEDGPEIKGGVDMEVTAGEDIAAGIGNKSKANQELDDVESGDISGGVKIVGTEGGDISAGIGNKSCASQKIGSVGGDSSACQ